MDVYKITLKISSFIFFLLTFLSIILNVWNDCEWIAFIINWCVGIACSIVVVIITTFIQFRIEQRKAIKALASEIRLLLFRYEIGGYAFNEDTSADEMSPKQRASFERLWFDEVDQSVKKIQKNCLELEFFFKRNNQPLLIKHSISILLELTKGGTKRDIYTRSKPFVYELAKVILQFKITEYDRKEIENYIENFEEHL